MSDGPAKADFYKPSGYYVYRCPEKYDRCRSCAMPQCGGRENPYAWSKRIAELKRDYEEAAYRKGAEDSARVCDAKAKTCLIAFQETGNETYRAEQQMAETCAIAIRSMGIT